MIDNVGGSPAGGNEGKPLAYEGDNHLSTVSPKSEKKSGLHELEESKRAAVKVAEIVAKMAWREIGSDIEKEKLLEAIPLTMQGRQNESPLIQDTNLLKILQDMKVKSEESRGEIKKAREAVIKRLSHTVMVWRGEHSPKTTRKSNLKAL